MGEWIRNKRRTDGFPRGLEGKKVEARHRDGEIFIGVVGEHKWMTVFHFNTADKSSSDVMAYRILEDEPALPDTDGWIEWHGGKCPVAEGTLVDVKFRDGREASSKPANVIDNRYSADASPAFWSSDGGGNDIVAYRLRKPEWPEDRIDVIGQNGNTGEHYNEVKMMNGKVELIPTPERIAFLKENAASAEDAFDRGKPNKYQRTIKGVTVDVYDVLVAFDVTCHAMAHAIKKMLMPGQRGSKDAEQDKREAIQAIERSIELDKS